MGGEFGMHGDRKINTKVQSEYLNGRDHFGKIDVDGSVVSR